MKLDPSIGFFVDVESGELCLMEAGSDAQSSLRCAMDRRLSYALVRCEGML